MNVFQRFYLIIRDNTATELYAKRIPNNENIREVKSAKTLINKGIS